MCSSWLSIRHLVLVQLNSYLMSLTFYIIFGLEMFVFLRNIMVEPDFEWFNHFFAAQFRFRLKLQWNLPVISTHLKLIILFKVRNINFTFLTSFMDLFLSWSWSSSNSNWVKYGLSSLCDLFLMAFCISSIYWAKQSLNNNKLLVAAVA